MVNLAEQERRSFSNELHDGILQQIIGAKLHLESLRHRASEGEAISSEQLRAIETILDDAVVESRRWIRALRGEVWETTRALLPSLVSLERESSATSPEVVVQVPSILPPAMQLPDEVSLALYRIAQEAVRNAIKHSRGMRVLVHCECSDEPPAIQVAIQDSGRGFEVNKKREDSFGLSIMRERARQVRAAFSITSAPGQGTRVTVRWEQVALSAATR